MSKIIKSDRSEGMPSLLTLPLFMLVLGLVFCGLFFWYPQFVAHSLGKVVAKLALLDFFDNHESLLQGLKYSINGFYVFSGVAVLDIVLMLFTYKVLDEIKQLNKGWKGALFGVLRGIWLLLAGQLAFGILVSLVGMFFSNYTCIYLMPPLFTSSWIGGVVMALWEVGTLLYAFLFIVKKWQLCPNRREVFTAHKPYWITFFVLSFLTTWFFAQILDLLAKGNSPFPNVVYVWLGAGLHTLLICGMVIYFINQFGAQDKSAEEDEGLTIKTREDVADPS